MSNKLIIYIDGGARGNPGPAAIGVVISLAIANPPASREKRGGLGEARRAGGNKQYSQAIGRATNNVAEYKAAIFALRKAKQLLGKKKSITEIEIKTDSELLYRQMNGQYKIKDKELKPLFIDIWNLQQDFKKVKFILIGRGENQEADRLVNSALNTLGF